MFCLYVDPMQCCVYMCGYRSNEGCYFLDLIRYKYCTTCEVLSRINKQSARINFLMDLKRSEIQIVASQQSRCSLLYCSELSENAQLLAKSAGVLGSTEEDMSLSRTLSELSDVTSKVSQLHADQSDVDFYVISELIKDYVCVIQSIKVCTDVLYVFYICNSLWSFLSFLYW